MSMSPSPLRMKTCPVRATESGRRAGEPDRGLAVVEFTAPNYFLFTFLVGYVSLCNPFSSHRSQAVLDRGAPSVHTYLSIVAGAKQVKKQSKHVVDVKSLPHAIRRSHAGYTPDSFRSSRRDAPRYCSTGPGRRHPWLGHVAGTRQRGLLLPCRIRIIPDQIIGSLAISSPVACLWTALNEGMNTRPLH